MTFKVADLDGLAIVFRPSNINERFTETRNANATVE